MPDIVDLCLLAVVHLEKLKDKEKIKSCLTGVLQVLSKISLAIDSYIPVIMLKSLEECIIKLKKMPEYGIKPVIEMIEANIYTNAVDKNTKLN